MSYQAGRMGVTEGATLVLVITIPHIFLSAVSAIIGQDLQAGWMVIVIGSLGAIAAGIACSFIYAWVPGDIVVVARTLLGRWAAWPIAGFYAVAYYAYGVLLLRQYGENTILTAMPNLGIDTILAWYLVFCAVMCYYGVEAMARAGFLLSPVLVVGIALVLVFLYPFYHVYFLTPWQGRGLEFVLPDGLEEASFDIGIMLLAVLAPSLQNARTIRKAALYGMGISLAVKTLYVVVFTLIFGVLAAQEKMMPFFEMARLVYFNRFFQRIEAPLMVLWVMFGLLAMALYFYLFLYLIARLLDLPTIRPLIPLVMVAAGQLALLPPDLNTAVQMDLGLVRVLLVGIYGIPGVLLALAAWRKRGVKPCPSGK